MKTHDDANIGVSSPQGVQDGRIRIENSLLVPLADIDVVGAQHEIDHIRLRGTHPARDVVPGDVICLIPGVTLVVSVKAGGFLAVAWGTVHRADELDAPCQVGSR